jgi:ribosome maturation factor RimP
VTNIDLMRLSEVIKEVVHNMGMRYYDLEYNTVSRILRVYIDKEKGGVTIQDCQNVSNALSRALDSSELVDIRYTLEVSSPGIERVLKRPEHYSWAQGNTVEVDTGVERIRGYLRDSNENRIVVAIGTDERTIPYSSIKKARVVEETRHDK